MSVMDVMGLINQPVFKLLRVLRTLRLVRRVPVLQMMLATLIGARTAIMSALLFLGIWIFIMAAVGSDSQWFAHLKHGKVIDSTWNFESLVNSMFLLFRTTTGDGWFDLIYDSQVSPPFCTSFVPAGATLANGMVLEKDDAKGDCGMGAVGVVYFIIFYLICNFIMLPLFVATLIDYFFEAEVDSISLFNNDDCDLYAEVWSEFDEEGDGKISIENLRPLIDRLGVRRHPAGFNTSSDMERFKAIWSRVFSNPKHFPADIPVTDEDDREDLKLSRITRDNIHKAYGEGARAKKIRAYIYAAHEGIKGPNRIVRGDEVEFRYTAKVLCIFRDGIRLPNTTSDLINMGTAKQMFVAFRYSKSAELGGHDLVPGRDGGENKRWSALAVHNELSRALGPVDSGGKRHDSDHKPGPDQLPNILKAQALMQVCTS